jgi:hypothetical protein
MRHQPTNPIQEADVFGGDAECVDFAHLIGRQRRDDVPEPTERVIQLLSASTLSLIRRSSSSLQFRLVELHLHSVGSRQLGDG